MQLLQSFGNDCFMIKRLIARNVLAPEKRTVCVQCNKQIR